MSAKAKIIGIVGTRSKNQKKHFEIVKEKIFEVYRPDDIICSGLCPKGADNFAKIIAEKYCLPRLWFPANWNEYGKYAGFYRNTFIAQWSEILIAMVAENRRGGVEDTIKKFINIHGIENLIILE